MDDARIRERDKLAVDPTTPGMVLALDALKRQASAWVHLHGATVRAAAQRSALAAVRKAVKEARAAGVLEADLKYCLRGSEDEPAAPAGRVKIDGVDRLRAVFSSFSFRPSDWWACIITPTGETRPTAMALESLVEGRLLADHSPLSPLVLPWTDEVQALVRMAEIKTAPYERSGIRGLYEPRPDLARVLHQHVLEGVGR